MVANGDGNKKIWATEYGSRPRPRATQTRPRISGDFLRGWRTLSFARARVHPHPRRQGRRRSCRGIVRPVLPGLDPEAGRLDRGDGDRRERRDRGGAERPLGAAGQTLSRRKAMSSLRPSSGRLADDRRIGGLDHRDASSCGIDLAGAASWRGGRRPSPAASRNSLRCTRSDAPVMALIRSTASISASPAAHAWQVSRRSRCPCRRCGPTAGRWCRSGAAIAWSPPAVFSRYTGMSVFERVERLDPPLEPGLHVLVVGVATVHDDRGGANLGRRVARVLQDLARRNAHAGCWPTPR